MDFVKESYGIGGRSHALSGADHSHADYDGKGLKLERGSYTHPESTVFLKWTQVAKRIEFLIDQDFYLKAEDYTRMSSYEREQLAKRIVSFYYRLPEEIERPFPDSFWGKKQDGSCRFCWSRKKQRKNWLKNGRSPCSLTVRI